jgi:hypothetical protein
MEFRIFPWMRHPIQVYLQFDPIHRPSFDDVLSFLRHTSRSAIVPGSNGNSVREYLTGVVDWELSRSWPVSTILPPPCECRRMNKQNPR